MHLKFLAHLCFFWVACHPSKTFPPKELGQEPQNRLSLSPYHQTTPSLTFNLWPTASVLAGYKLVVPESCACSTPIWVQCLSGVHAFAIANGFVWHCCMFCCFFNLLWREWVIGFSSSHIVSSLGWVLLGCRPLLLSIRPLSLFTLGLWVD